MNVEPKLDMLEYLVYKDAGKHHSNVRLVHLEKSWWQFWKPPHKWERYEATNAEKAVSGRKFVNSYVCINPYTSLIERIEKMRIRHTMGKLEDDAFTELCVDVEYHCGKCEDYEVHDFKQELLK